MAPFKEILTIQIGHYSNFVGTNWWNLQESSFVYDPRLAATVEVDHDVLFRQGCTHSGEVTYTPRLIAVDLRGSLSTLSREDTVGTVDQQNLLWDGSTELHQTTPSPKNEFLQSLEDTEELPSAPLDLEKRIKVWSDFLKPSLHQRSIHIISDYQHENQVEPFDIFPLGRQVLSKKEQQEELEDKVRYFVEECDYLQGFNFLLDAGNAFGGFASHLLEHISDEYAGKSNLSIPLLPLDDSLNLRQKMEGTINCGFVMESLMEHASLVCPVSVDSSWFSNRARNFEHIDYQASLPYHSSAVLAAALDTATMPLRTKVGSAMSLMDLDHYLVRPNRRVVGLFTALPFLATTKSMADGLANRLVPLTPGVETLHPLWSQTLTWRGVTDPAASQSTVDDWATHLWADGVTTNTLMCQPCPAHVPYPRFFKESAQISSKTGFPTVSGLHSSPVLGSGCLRHLSDSVNRINVKKLHRFTSLGLEEDDLMANRDALVGSWRAYGLNPDGSM